MSAAHETLTCTPAERLLLESRRAAAEELYRRADEILAQAVDAVLSSHGAALEGRPASIAYRGDVMLLVLGKPEEPAEPQPAPRAEPEGEK